MKNTKVFVLAVAFLGILVFPNFSSAATVDELQVKINELLQQVKILQEQLNAQQSSGGNTGSAISSVATTIKCPVLKRNLFLGVRDSQSDGEVSKLQEYLTQDKDIYPEGLITGYFGPATEKAVQKWQEKQKIVSSGDRNSTGYGFVGPTTKSILNKICSIKNTETPIPTLPPVLTTPTTPTVPDPSVSTTSTVFPVIPPTTSPVPSETISSISSIVSSISSSITTPSVVTSTTTATTTPSITVLSPNGGETWVVGAQQTIKWRRPTEFLGKTIKSTLLIKGRDDSGAFTKTVFTIFKDLTVNILSSFSNETLWKGQLSSLPLGEYKVSVSEYTTINPSQIFSDESDALFNVVAATTSAGVLSVSLDSSNPSYYIAAGNTTNNILSVLKLSATNESIDLKKINLQLGSGNSAQDLTQVTLWDGETKVGTALFTSGQTTVSVTLSSSFIIPANGSKLLIIKGDFAQIGTIYPGKSGDLVKVDYDGDSTNGTYGTGTNSGATIYSSSTTDTNSVGVRIMKSFPIFTKLSVGATKLISGSGVSLYRFKVTSSSTGDIGMGKFTIHVATTSTSINSKMINNINIYAFTDSGFSMPVSGVGSSGHLQQTPISLNTWASPSTDISVYAQTSAGDSTAVQIPAGQTRYFDVVGDVSLVGMFSSLSTQIQGDAAYTISSMGTLSTINADTNNDLLWSPNSTNVASVNDVDWTNGYGVSGLPSDGMTQEILTTSGAVGSVSNSGQMANMLSAVQDILKQLTNLLKK